MFSALTSEAVESTIDQGINSRPTISKLACIVSLSAEQGNFDPGAGWWLREGVDRANDAWGLEPRQRFCDRLISCGLPNGRVAKATIDLV